MMIGDTVYWFDDNSEAVFSGTIVACGESKLLIKSRQFEMCVHKDAVRHKQSDVYECQREHLEREMGVASDNLDLAREKVSACWKKISELKKVGASNE